jgi:DNA (cytosine-5)-methyltransferase 3A
MNVLSLFDGMSCGQIALDRLGIKVDKYYASEIDKYAIAVAKANYPDTIHVGDITQLDPKAFQDIDLILAGSPCQGFSFAGKQLAFDDPRSALFFEFIRLLKAIKPKYFLLENVRMKQQYIDVITQQVSECYPEHQGNDLFDSKIEPILINSALLSAQSRQRLYWTNIPNVKQPEDLSIVLKDILEDDVEEHYLAGKNLLENYQGGNQLNPNYKSQANTIHDKNKKSGVICAGTHGYANGYVETKPKQVGKVKDGGQGNRIYSTDGKSSTLSAQSGGTAGNGNTLIETKPKQIGKTDTPGHDILKRVYSEDGKSPTITAHAGKGTVPKIVSGALRARSKNQDGKNVSWKETKPKQMLELRKDEKSNSITSVSKDSLVVSKIREKSKTVRSGGRGSNDRHEWGKIYDVEERIVVDSERKRLIIAEANAKGYTIIEDGDCFDINYPNSKTRRGRKMKYKCNALTPSAQEYMHFKNLTWRKLTPLECERLQTVPDNYTASVSNTQRYKMLGNGWTVEVIAHILTNMETK